MRMGWKLRRHILCLKAEVIIAVRLLCLAAWAHLVDLSGHLIVRAKPCLTGRCNRGIAKIGHIIFGIHHAMLLQAIPYTIVGPSGGKVIALAGPCYAFLVNDAVKHIRCAINNRDIRIHRFEGNHPRRMTQHIGPFGHERAAGRRIAQISAQRDHVIDRHVVHNFGRTRHVFAREDT